MDRIQGIFLWLLGVYEWVTAGTYTYFNARSTPNVGSHLLQVYHKGPVRHLYLPSNTAHPPCNYVTYIVFSINLGTSV
jgi:hypothetical protein